LNTRSLHTRLPLARLLAVACLFAGSFATAARADAPSREYQFKAAFVFNFVQYAHWPPTAFKDAKDPIVITVLGDNPFEDDLEQIVQGKKVDGRDILVRYAKDPAVAARTSHVVYVAPSEQHRLDKILPALTAAPVMTVSDTHGFTAWGGVIRIFTEDNKLRFEINKKAARRAGINFSAKLLKLARFYDHE
jgi:hypothetical protein